MAEFKILGETKLINGDFIYVCSKLPFNGKTYWECQKLIIREKVYLEISIREKRFRVFGFLDKIPFGKNTVNHSKHSYVVLK